MAKIKVSFWVNISDNDIDTIIDIARTGAAHWCESIKQISENTWGVHNTVNPGFDTFTRDNLISGIQKYLETPTAGDFLEIVDHELRIDTEYVDEEIADAIIQYALYDRIIYAQGVRIHS